VPNLVAIGQTVTEIWRLFHFQEGGRRHVGFLSFKFLTVDRQKRIELRHRAKFRRNWSNRCRDMAIF